MSLLAVLTARKQRPAHRTLYLPLHRQSAVNGCVNFVALPKRKQ
jgi:hypothetical protein